MNARRAAMTRGLRYAGMAMLTALLACGGETREPVTASVSTVVPLPEIRDFGAFDRRPSRVTPRGREALVEELTKLENAYKALPHESPDRPSLMRHIAEDYVELESAAELEMARVERPEIAERAETIVTRARLVAEHWYSLLVNDYPGEASLDEALFELGYECERGGEPDKARRVYFQLIQRFPDSKYVPIAYLAFAELFLDEAKTDEAKWDLALQAYSQVAKYAPQSNPAYGYALYKLGYVWWHKRQFERARAAFKMTLAYVSDHPDSPNAARLQESAGRQVAILGGLQGASIDENHDPRTKDIPDGGGVGEER